MFPWDIFAGIKKREELEAIRKPNIRPHMDGTLEIDPEKLYNSCRMGLYGADLLPPVSSFFSQTKSNKIMESELSKNQTESAAALAFKAAENNKSSLEEFKQGFKTGEKHPDPIAERLQPFKPQKPSVGRIVHIYPASNQPLLPNGMEFAPAIIVQVFEGELQHINAVAFIAVRADQGWHQPYYPVFSAEFEKHENQFDGIKSWNTYWVWPPVVR